MIIRLRDDKYKVYLKQRDDDTSIDVYVHACRHQGLLYRRGFFRTLKRGTNLWDELLNEAKKVRTES